MSFVGEFGAALRDIVVALLWVWAILWCVERLFPKAPVPLAVQLRSVPFWLVYVLFGAATIAGFAVLKAAVDLRPLVLLRPGSYVPTWLAYILGPVLFMTFYDFFGYWMHRAQHRWFWAQHAVHHAIRDLSAVNSYLHWTEEGFRLVFIAMPTSLFLGLEPMGVTTVAIFLNSLHGNYLHSASEVHFGRIGRLYFADNRWHRIHHSMDPAHFDRNFGTAVTIWDRLFGTAYDPADDEWPATGVADRPEVTTLDDFLWRPFRPGRGTAVRP